MRVYLDSRFTFCRSSQALTTDHFHTKSNEKYPISPATTEQIAQPSKNAGPNTDSDCENHVQLNSKSKDEILVPSTVLPTK